MLDSTYEVLSLLCCVSGFKQTWPYELWLHDLTVSLGNESVKEIMWFVQTLLANLSGASTFLLEGRCFLLENAQINLTCSAFFQLDCQEHEH